MPYCIIYKKLVLSRLWPGKPKERSVKYLLGKDALHVVHTGLEAHPASYPAGHKGLLPLG
jgi:hypothetical protein